MPFSRPLTVFALAVTLAWLASANASAQYAHYAGYSQPDPYGQSEAGYGSEASDCSESNYCFPNVCDPGDCGPRWIFAAEAIALQRTHARRQTLFGQTTPGDLLNAQDMEFPLRIGPQLSAIRRGPCGWELEVAYFQVNGSAAESTVPAPSFVAVDSRGPVYYITNVAQARYTSDLYNGEINLRRQWLDWLNLSAGFRMVELDELYHSEAPPGGTQLETHQNVRTVNHLMGFQLGANAEVYNMGGPLLVNVFCKGGIFGNHARQSNQFYVVDTAEDVLEARSNHAAFLGEAGVTLTYALTEHLAFRASAKALWLDGVALAPEQLATTDFNTSSAAVNRDGGVFYYGGGLGLEYRY